MKNKTQPENMKIQNADWFIAFHNSQAKDKPYLVQIDYWLGDENNKKSHRFATYPEAYQWLDNLVQL